MGPTQRRPLRGIPRERRRNGNSANALVEVKQASPAEEDNFPAEAKALRRLPTLTQAIVIIIAMMYMIYLTIMIALTGTTII